MAGTRSSTRQAAKADPQASSQSQLEPITGSKRKAHSGTNSKSKREKRDDKKAQTTIKASVPTEDQEGESKDVEMNDEPERTKEDETGEAREGDDKIAGEDEPSSKETDPKEEHEVQTKETKTENNAFDSMMDRNGDSEPKDATDEGRGSKVSKEDNAVEDSSKRDEETPSSILEKGIIYFFFRGRVGINEPSDITDIARSYIILRPVPHGAKIGEGPIGDAGNNRMLALPKKVLPVSPKDRFMTFVEKTNCSMDDIKTSLSSSDYTTKTAGARHTPAATPIGEGVYAITSTGHETHLAYILTIPSELEEVQKGVGLRQRCSYLTSAKNPESTSPANTSLPRGAEYPKEIIDEFHGRGWMPLQPKLLNYKNTQFLLIGHKDGALEKATIPQEGGDEKPGKETPLEEIEKLEHEDEVRVEHLKEDDAVFIDLGLSLKEYPKVQTSW